MPRQPSPPATSTMEPLSRFWPARQPLAPRSSLLVRGSFVCLPQRLSDGLRVHSPQSSKSDQLVRHEYTGRVTWMEPVAVPCESTGQVCSASDYARHLITEQRTHAECSLPVAQHPRHEKVACSLRLLGNPSLPSIDLPREPEAYSGRLRQRSILFPGASANKEHNLQGPKQQWGLGTRNPPGSRDQVRHMTSTPDAVRFQLRRAAQQPLNRV